MRTPLARWSRSLEALRALSVRQPYAWLIVKGYKDVENRWRATRHRGPLLIQAGLNKSNLDDLCSDIEGRFGIQLPEEFDAGGVVGVVDIIACKLRSRSPRYERGAVAWRLAYPRRLPYRPCRGALSFFKPSFEK